MMNPNVYYHLMSNGYFFNARGGVLTPAGTSNEIAIPLGGGAEGDPTLEPDTGGGSTGGGGAEGDPTLGPTGGTGTGSDPYGQLPEIEQLGEHIEELGEAIEDLEQEIDDDNDVVLVGNYGGGYGGGYGGAPSGGATGSIIAPPKKNWLWLVCMGAGAYLMLSKK